MPLRRLKVELLGLYPTIFTTACKAVCNPTGVAGILTWKEQLKEYPDEMLKDLEAAASLTEWLSRYDDVEVRLVNAMSPRGLWLTAKHRLGSGLWVIVEGTALDARGPGIVEAIEERLRRRKKI